MFDPYEDQLDCDCCGGDDADCEYCGGDGFVSASEVAAARNDDLAIRLFEG